MLAPLDTVALRFFKAMRRIIPTTPGPAQYVWLGNGHDVERWMLKALLGSIASGNLQMYGPVNWQTHPEWDRWIRLLLAMEPWPPSWGLYLAGDVGDTVRVEDASLGTTILHHALTNQAAGIVISVCGFQFKLLLGDAHGSRVSSVFEGSTYRPKHIAFAGPGFRRSLVLYWDVTGDCKGIELHHEPR